MASTIGTCLYNKMIDCPPDGRNCIRCGWNPLVRTERLQRGARRPMVREAKRADGPNTKA